MGSQKTISCVQLGQYQYELSSIASFVTLKRQQHMLLFFSFSFLGGGDSFKASCPIPPPLSHFSSLPSIPPTQPMPPTHKQVINTCPWSSMCEFLMECCKPYCTSAICASWKVWNLQEQQGLHIKTKTLQPPTVMQERTFKFPQILICKK